MSGSGTAETPNTEGVRGFFVPNHRQAAGGGCTRRRAGLQRVPGRGSKVGLVERDEWEQASEDERLQFLADARASTDSGRRYSLDEVAAALGIDLSES